MVAAGGQKHLQQTDGAKRPMHRVQEQGVRENTKGRGACRDEESGRQGGLIWTQPDSQRGEQVLERVAMQVQQEALESRIPNSNLERTTFGRSAGQGR